MTLTFVEREDKEISVPLTDLADGHQPCRLGLHPIKISFLNVHLQSCQRS